MDLILTKEYFAHRHDKLYERQHNQRTGWITEYFKEGRHKNLKGCNRRKFLPRFARCTQFDDM